MSLDSGLGVPAVVQSWEGVKPLYRRHPRLTSRISAIRARVRPEGMWPAIMQCQVGRDMLEAVWSWMGEKPLNFNRTFFFPNFTGQPQWAY